MNDVQMTIDWARPVMGFLIFTGLFAALVWQIRRHLYEQKKWQMFLQNRSTPQILDNLGGLEFEVWVQQLFISMGLKAEVTGSRRNDHGVDVVVYYKNKRIAIQCKRFRPTDNIKWKVGEKTVRDIYGVKWGDKFDLAMVITTGNFTWEAMEWAKGKKDLKLVNGHLLGKIILNRKLLLELLDS
jgi:HJR/Mrr/RecB family endonuclease